MVMHGRLPEEPIAKMTPDNIARDAASCFVLGLSGMFDSDTVSLGWRYIIRDTNRIAVKCIKPHKKVDALYEIVGIACMCIP